jgi:hypothetical protein
MGLSIGHLEGQVPTGWGPPTQSAFRVDTALLTMTTYPAHMRTLSQDGEILMLVLQEGYRGTSARGIAIGSRAQDVLARYGPPTRRLETTQGQSWSYDTHRLAFQMRDGRVISWLLF